MNIGLVAAIPGELAPLVSGFTRHPAEQAGRKLTVFEGQLTLANGTPAHVWACAGGIGAGPAAAAFQAVREAAAGQLDAIISYGWAGALTCGVKPPDVYCATEVIDTRTGERWPTATPHADGQPAIRTVTVDHIVLPDEKRALAERYRAVLADMEGATVARLAAAHGIPFFCLKGISDGYTDQLPDLNRFLTPQGTMRIPALVAHALIHPQHWRPLARLGGQSSAAARLMAQALPACFERAGLIS